MKKSILTFVAALFALVLSAGVAAQDSKPTLKWYGFVRNFFTFDTRESLSGVEDLFFYVPRDRKVVNGEDVNAVNSFRFAALTSRLGLDINGYQINGWNVDARLEMDFHAGVTGVTGVALTRLRQAYVSFAKENFSIKVGQTWNPMATDLPVIFDVNSGAPFGPFGRNPQVTAEYKFTDALSVTGSILWQMQYTSQGPSWDAASHSYKSAASADYIKYGLIPELFVGLNYKSGKFLARAGVDMTTIRPRHTDGASGVKVNDRITNISPYMFLQYADGMFTAKFKTIFAQSGEHLFLNGGYGVTSINADHSWNYTPTRNSSSWLSLSYGKKVQAVFFAGYARNFGTAQDIISPDYLYFNKNSFSNMNAMWRLTPGISYNVGKVTLAFDWEITSVQYGSWGIGDKRALATQDLHWITNNRLQAMVRYSF